MRTAKHCTNGATHVHVHGDAVTVHADPTITTAYAVLTPLVEDDRDARERINNATITSEKGQFAIRLPATTNHGSGGTTIIGNGGATVIQSGSTGVGQVNIVRGSGTIINGTGTVFMSGNGVTYTTIGGGVHTAIYAPKGSSLTAHTTSGDISTEGDLADVEVETTSGDIQLARTTGAITAESASGDIAVSRACGPARLESSSGDIETGALDQGGRLRASSGDIRACLAGKELLEVRASSGDIELTTSIDTTEDYLWWRASSGRVRVNGSKRSNSSRS